MATAAGGEVLVPDESGGATSGAAVPASDQAEVAGRGATAEVGDARSGAGAVQDTIENVKISAIAALRILEYTDTPGIVSIEAS